MKKKLLAVLLVVPFVISACGTTTDTASKTDTEIASETESETEVFEMDPAFVGEWVTGENEDQTVILINENKTWQVIDIEGIEGFEEAGGEVKVLEDAIQLYNGDELYDTVYFGAEENTLYSDNGYTYTIYDEVMVVDPTYFSGLWVCGENEDTTYLFINMDTWLMIPTGDESSEVFGGMTEPQEDCLALYNGDELYTTVAVGSDDNTLLTVENTYELVSAGFGDFLGCWVTGENEDTTAIRIEEDLTWHVINIDDIEGFEEIGGDVIPQEDCIELYSDEGLYDTLSFGADAALFGEDGKTYTRDDSLMNESLGDFIGVWQTGENEDMSYLVIQDDNTWKLLPADDIEGADEFGGEAVLTEDSLELYNDGDLYNTVYFGSEENTLYSSIGYEYVLISKDYNEVGDQ